MILQTLGPVHSEATSTALPFSNTSRWSVPRKMSRTHKKKSSYQIRALKTNAPELGKRVTLPEHVFLISPNNCSSSYNNICVDIVKGTEALPHCERHSPLEDDKLSKIQSILTLLR